MDVRGADEVVGRKVIKIRDVLHDVVPDGTGSSDADDIVHGAVVAVACPDADGDMGCIAHGPVVAETLGGAGFCGCRAIEFEGIAGTELVVARSFVGEDATYKESHF